VRGAVHRDAVLGAVAAHVVVHALRHAAPNLTRQLAAIGEGRSSPEPQAGPALVVEVLRQVGRPAVGVGIRRLRPHPAPRVVRPSGLAVARVGLPDHAAGRVVAEGPVAVVGVVGRDAPRQRVVGRAPAVPGLVHHLRQPVQPVVDHRHAVRRPAGLPRPAQEALDLHHLAERVLVRDRVAPQLVPRNLGDEAIGGGPDGGGSKI
jgi:hypothetical protein